MNRYTSPISLHIIWHPNFADGGEIGKELFSTFCRDTNQPLDQRLGIPTYFKSSVSENGKPIPIDFDESDRTMVVCLIDNYLILDESFKEYVVQVYSKCFKRKDTKFIPVALNKAAYRLDTEIGKLNYIKASADDLKEGESCIERIFHHVLHELCKMFVAADETDKTAPIKLFISHSKHDESVKDAIILRDYINSNTQLKTFFDANDIGFGDDFAKVIEANAGKCVVVALMSDSFSTREWCKAEVIIAKKKHCPIVVINAVNTGEKRSFPYIGNVPTRRWNSDIRPIINLALITCLNNLYTKEALEKQAKFFNVQYDIILSTYPELFSIIGIKEKMKEDSKEIAAIIYSDPPLGNEEIRLLNQMDERLSFITPLQLSTLLPYE